MLLFKKSFKKLSLQAFIKIENLSQNADFSSFFPTKKFSFRPPKVAEGKCRYLLMPIQIINQTKYINFQNHFLSGRSSVNLVFSLKVIITVISLSGR